MLLYIGYILFLGLYFVAPFKARIVLWLLNLVIPDPLPYIDEIIMTLGLLVKLIRK